MKKCFKCGLEKILDDFYKHPQMPDGHVNKCKDCTRKDVRENYTNKSVDEQWLEKERERSRAKYHRLYKDTVHGSKRPRNQHIKKMFNLPLLPKEEMHHWSYAEENLGSLIIVNRRLHKRLHSVMSKGDNNNIYYFRGEPLDTKQKQIDLAVWVNNMFNTNSRIIDCEISRQKGTRNTLSPYWGIYKDRNKLMVRIYRNNKSIIVGYYDNYEDAIIARDKYVEDNDIPNTIKFNLIS